MSTNAEYWIARMGQEGLRDVLAHIHHTDVRNLQLWQRQLKTLMERPESGLNDDGEPYWMVSTVYSDLRSVRDHMKSRLKELGISMEDDTDNADYITLLQTVTGQRALVVIQHYDKVNDTWVQKRCSDALSTRAAHALAESWAAALHLEIR